MLLAEQMKADLLIIDDNAAKKTAKFMGFDVTGTLGILLLSKKKGHIHAVKPLMDCLMEDGFFVSDEVRGYVLEEAGEI